MYLEHLSRVCSFFEQFNFFFLRTGPSGCGSGRVLITTDDVTNACTNFTNVVIRIMRDDKSKGGCNSSKI
jgi:hypothetical protein